MDLFTPVVPADKLHQNFARTLDDAAAGVRDVLARWAEGFEDRDGKFQTLERAWRHAAGLKFKRPGRWQLDKWADIVSQACASPLASVLQP